MRRHRKLLLAFASFIALSVPVASQAQCADPKPLMVQGREMIDLPRVCVRDVPP